MMEGGRERERERDRERDPSFKSAWEVLSSKVIIMM